VILTISYDLALLNNYEFQNMILKIYFKKGFQNPQLLLQIGADLDKSIAGSKIILLSKIVTMNFAPC